MRGLSGSRRPFCDCSIQSFPLWCCSFPLKGLLLLTRVTSVRLRRRIALSTRSAMPKVRHEVLLLALAFVGPASPDVTKLEPTPTGAPVLGVVVQLHAKRGASPRGPRRRAKVRPRRAHAVQVVGRIPSAAGPAPLRQVQEARRVAGSPSAVPTSTPSGADVDHLSSDLLQRLAIRWVTIGASAAAVAIATSAIPLPVLPA